MSDLPGIKEAALKALAEKDFAEFACLLALLGEHPIIACDNTLSGAVAALNAQFVVLWDEVERHTE